MSDQRTDTPVVTRPAARRRFVAPQVENLGGLTLITLGSVGGEGLRQSLPSDSNQRLA